MLSAAFVVVLRGEPRASSRTRWKGVFLECATERSLRGAAGAFDDQVARAPGTPRIDEFEHTRASGGRAVSPGPPREVVKVSDGTRDQETGRERCWILCAVTAVVARAYEIAELRSEIFAFRGGEVKSDPLPRLAKMGREISLTYAASVNEALSAANLNANDLAAVADGTIDLI